MPSPVELPPPVFVGFFPKHPESSADTIKAPGVDRIHSVSNCISQGPPEWIQAWQHNDLGFYEDQETARSVVGEAVGFDLYAYSVFPVRWNEDGSLESWNPRPAPGAVPKGFELLGYDAVSQSQSSFFECSPLSCNGGFNDFDVNEYCLFGDLAAAVAAMPQLATGNYEPGAYFLVAVYRERG